MAAARAADAAIGADDNYCASVARVGTPVNTAVHNFKLAWNAEQSPKVPINTGNYELATGDALYKVLGEAFEPCAARTARTTTTPRATPVIAPALEPKKEGLSTGEIVGVSLLGAGAVGGVVYLATKPRRRR
jgi:hypothetical protein